MISYLLDLKKIIKEKYMDLLKPPKPAKKDKVFMSTVKAQSQWIKTNAAFFLTSVAFFTMLKIFNDMTLMKSNLLFTFLSSFISICIFLGLITVLLLKYKGINKISVTKIMMILFHAALLTLYLYLTSVLITAFASSISWILTILLFGGNIVAVLSIYNMVTKEDPIGIKASIQMVFTNKGFFIKLFFIQLFFQMFLVGIVGIPLKDIFEPEVFTNLIPSISLLGNSFFIPLSYIFFDSKVKKEEDIDRS